ncbi:hypothetical protein BGZ65_003412, partial [Modicella reniformis]
KVLLRYARQKLVQFRTNHKERKPMKDARMFLFGLHRGSKGSFPLRCAKKGFFSVPKPLQKCRHLGLKVIQEEIIILRHRFLKQQRTGQDGPQFWMKITSILDFLCELGSNLKLVENPSEADIVAQWATVFRHLLAGTDIHVQTGERVSLASKAIKEHLTEVHGNVGFRGRKVDLTFLLDKIELANFEFKIDGLGSLIYQVQHLKNIRLNRAGAIIP